VQSGKFDRPKKLVESLRAFGQTVGRSFRLVLAGQLLPEVEAEAKRLINADPRVIELGWLDPSRLRDLLCAADVYVQPGSQSATMQMSLCCRCAVILDDVPSHRVFVTDNGILLRAPLTLASAFAQMTAMPIEQLRQMGNRSAAIAASMLDYRRLAARVC
jgi:1,2-diacylglycerol 3-alpha-glucosyltransferase